MKQLFVLVIYLLLSACATTNSTETKPNQTVQPKKIEKPLSSSEKQYLARIESDGRLLYEKDIRAANATDVVLAAINPKDYPNFVGWVTYKKGNNYTVSFYEQDGENFKIIADVAYPNKNSAKMNLKPSRKPSNLEISMMKARIAAIKSGVNSCSKRFNTIVIPSQNPDHWDVYIIAASTNPKLIQVGGHIKTTVSKSTSEIISREPLARSCISLDKSDKNIPKGASLAGLWVTHVVSPLPVAIHTYLTLLHKADFFVGTERGIFMIKAGKASYMGQ